MLHPTLPCQVIAVAESAGPSGIEQALAAAQDQVADLQRQLADADGVRRGLEKELSRARKQLADEQSERNTLEEHMITRLEDMGDDVAQVGAGFPAHMLHAHGHTLLCVTLAVKQCAEHGTAPSQR